MSISYEPLFKILTEKKLKLADLQKDLGISKPTLAKFNKNLPMSLSFLEQIAEYLECDIGDLVTIKNNTIRKAHEEMSATADIASLLLPERFQITIKSVEGQKIYEGEITIE